MLGQSATIIMIKLMPPKFRLLLRVTITRQEDHAHINPSPNGASTSPRLGKTVLILSNISIGHLRLTFDQAMSVRDVKANATGSIRARDVSSIRSTVR